MRLSILAHTRTTASPAQGIDEGNAPALLVTGTATAAVLVFSLSVVEDLTRQPARTNTALLRTVQIVPLVSLMCGRKALRDHQLASTIPVV